MNVPRLNRRPARTGPGRALIAAAVSAAMLTAGCSNSGSAATSDPPIGALPVFTSDSRLTMPLDTYLETTDQVYTGLEANELLVDQCMAKAGFTFRLGIPSQPAQVLLSHIGKFYVDNPVSAKTSGYGGNAALIEQSQTRSVPGDQATAAERAALQGDASVSVLQTPGKPATGGCVGQAEKALEKGAPASALAPTDVMNMVNSTYGQMVTDSRVTELETAWSTCMAKAGYDFKTPEQANNSPTASAESGGNPSPAQIQQAVADVTCKQQVKLVPTEIAVWTAFENQLINLNQQQLSLEKQQLSVEADNAATIIAQGGSASS